MDLNAVLIFIRVVEEGSFRGAARALGLPKSSVSRRVSRLEEQLGARLLERSTRHLRLTEVGTAYYHRAVSALSALEDAARAVDELQAEPRGILRLSAPVTFGHLYLSKILAAYLTSCPQVRVAVELSDRRVELIEEGFDLTIRAGPLTDSSLFARRLGDSPLQIFASPTYLRAKGAPGQPEDLAAHDCLVCSAAPGPVRWPFQRERKIMQVEVEGRVAVNSFFILRDLAIAGLGIALMPAFVGARAVEEGKLQTILDEFQLPPPPLHAVYPSVRNFSPKLRAFVDLLAKSDLSRLLAP